MKYEDNYEEEYRGVDDEGYETEEVDEENAAIDGVPKLKIFFNIIGILVLIFAVVVLGYFQYEQLQIAKNAPIPNMSYSIYNSSCEDGVCFYKLKSQLPKELECFYKGNKTKCSEISFDFLIEGTKKCVEGLCIFNTSEVIDKCSYEGWAINCNEIEVKRIEE